MKVFNLTDISTPVLEQRGLVEQHIAVGRSMIRPGEFAEVEDTPHTRSKLDFLVTVGGVAIDSLPPNYVKAREALAASGGRPSPLSPLPARHVEISETRPASDPQGPPPDASTEASAPVVLERKQPEAAPEAPAAGTAEPEEAPPANAGRNQPKRR